MKLNRRGFLKLVGAALAAVGLGGVAGKPEAARLDECSMAVSDGPIDKFVGLWLKSRLEAMWFIGWLDGQGAWPVTITMPCGETLAINSRGEFPMDSIACPCGDARHVFVEYGEHLPQAPTIGYMYYRKKEGGGYELIGFGDA